MAGYDAVLIATDHDRSIMPLLAKSASLIVDTRNVFARLGLAADQSSRHDADARVSCR